MDKLILITTAPSQTRPNTVGLSITKAVSRHLRLFDIPLAINVMYANFSLFNGPSSTLAYPPAPTDSTANATAECVDWYSIFDGGYPSTKKIQRLQKKSKTDYPSSYR